MGRNRREGFAECGTCGRVGPQLAIVNHWWDTHVHFKDHKFVCFVCRVGFGPRELLEAHLKTDGHQRHRRQQQLPTPHAPNPKSRKIQINWEEDADVRLLNPEEASRLGLCGPATSVKGSPSSQDGGDSLSVPAETQADPESSPAAMEVAKPSPAASREEQEAEEEELGQPPEVSITEESEEEEVVAPSRWKRKAYLSDSSDSEEERDWKRIRADPSSPTRGISSERGPAGEPMSGSATATAESAPPPPSSGKGEQRQKDSGSSASKSALPPPSSGKGEQRQKDSGSSASKSALPPPSSGKGEQRQKDSGSSVSESAPPPPSSEKSEPRQGDVPRQGENSRSAHGLSRGSVAKAAMPPPSSGTGEPSIRKSAPSTSHSGQPRPGEMAPPRPGPSSKLATRWSPLITIRSSSSGVTTREVGPPLPEPHRTSAVADPPLPPSTGELPVTEAAPPLPGPSMPSTGNSQTMEGVFREGLQALNRTLEKSVGSPHEWDLLRREIRDLTRGLENKLVTPNLELKQETIKVRMAAEGIRADTRKLQELAGLKGAIESVRDMWLPLFHQHVENQRVANLQMIEQNRQLGTILQIWENERAGRGTTPKSNNHH